MPVLAGRNLGPDLQRSRRRAGAPDFRQSQVMGTVGHERLFSGIDMHIACKRGVRAVKDNLCNKPVNRTFQRQVQESGVAASVGETEPAFFLRFGDEHGVAAEVILRLLAESTLEVGSSAMGATRLLTSTKWRPS